MALMLFTALTAAVLTNDAAAVIGTPLALVLARRLSKPATIPLLALCAAATIGSLLTPVGNPENVLIAAKGHFSNPVGTFFIWLTVPAVLSFLFAFAWFTRCLKRSPRQEPDGSLRLPDHPDTRVLPALVATAILVVLVLVDSLSQGAAGEVLLPLGAICLIATLPVLAFDRHRFKAALELDWATLAFLVAMFVVTSAVLKSNVLQDWLAPVQNQLKSPPVIYLSGFWASQFSNVPTVEIYLNLLSKSGVEASMLLAASSTLAGNLFILSAASNVIVVQQTEKLGLRPFGFWQFFAFCLPVTLASLLIS